MKGIVSVTLLSLLFLSGCNNDASTSDTMTTRLQQSLYQWQQLKQEHNSTYNYRVVSNGFEPSNHALVTYVVHDDVVKLEFFEWDRNATMPQTPLWTEYTDTLNTHTVTTVLPLGSLHDSIAKNIDELYNECEHILQITQTYKKPYLILDDNGILQICSDGGIDGDENVVSIDIMTWE